MLAIVSRNSEACSLSVPLILLGDAIRHLMMCITRSRGVTEVMAWNCEAPWNGNNELFARKGLPRKQTIPYLFRSVICIYLWKHTIHIQMILCVKSLVGQLKHGWLRVLVSSEILYRKKMGPCAFSSCCVVMLGITSCQGRLFWSPPNTTWFESSSHLFGWVTYFETQIIGKPQGRWFDDSSPRPHCFVLNWVLFGVRKCKNGPKWQSKRWEKAGKTLEWSWKAKPDFSGFYVGS